MLELLCPIRKNAYERPETYAILTDDETITYKTLNEKIEATTDLLKRKGVQPKQRVAFIAKQNVETIVLLFALCRMQVTSCPINSRLPQKSIEDRVRDVQASFFIDSDTLSLTYLEGDNQKPFFEIFPLFSLLTTSGSTSEPKIVAHTFENFYYSALGSNLSIGLQNIHRWLLSLPLYHVGGISLIFRCFLVGAGIVISEQGMVDALTQHKVSHVSFVSTQLYRLLKQMNTSTLPHLEMILVGGGPISKKLCQSAIAQGLKIFPTYGMTEMSSQITMESLKLNEDDFSAGIPLPFRQVKISPNGEIMVKGKTLFQGYWTREKQIELPLEDGWFSTKDLGTFTKDGRLIVLGRKDNMFISGGENIHPELIERELYELRGIEQAFVIPTLDEEYGQRPVAFIKQNDKKYSLEEVRTLLREKLPGYCLPIKLIHLPDQENFEGKISKKWLIEQLIEVCKLEPNIPMKS
jgi:O-succinylbenzoic acid--CoA ligase